MLIHITSSNFSPVREKLQQKCETYAMAQAVPLDITRSIDRILRWSFQLTSGLWEPAFFFLFFVVDLQKYI